MVMNFAHSCFNQPKETLDAHVPRNSNVPLSCAYSLLCGCSSNLSSAARDINAVFLDDSWASEKTFLVLLEVGTLVQIPLVSPPPLLKKSVSGLSKDAHLCVLDTGQPVAEGAANAGVHRVCPKGLALEHWAHLNAELPDADGNACEDNEYTQG